MRGIRQWLVLAIAACFILLPSLGEAADGVIQLPKTGQSASYAAGDDFDINAGVAWPAFRFQDNKDGTITDILTGLMWPKNARIGSGTWQECLDLVKTLNIGGHTDWRMPNINELMSLFQPEILTSCWLTSEGFRSIQSDAYWSSTSYGIAPDFVLAVNFPSSFVSNENKSNLHFLLPVRSGQKGIIELPRTGQSKCFSATDNGTEIACAGTGQDGDIQAGVAWPEPRFQDNGDGTVTDKLTGLMWTKDANLLNPTGDLNWFEYGKSWEDSFGYVKALTTGGYTDWRLPNFNELRSLMDYSQHEPALPSGHPFINHTGYGYWTSTSQLGANPGAWEIVLDTGLIYPWDKSTTYSVWPVRGGYFSSDGTADNSTMIHKSFYLIGAQVAFRTSALSAVIPGFVLPGAVSEFNQYVFFTQDGKFYSRNPMAELEILSNDFMGVGDHRNPYCDMGAYTIAENGELKAKISHYFLGVWEIKLEITGAVRNGIMVGLGTYVAYGYPFIIPFSAFVFIGSHIPPADFIMQQIQDFCEQ